jgi:hypothetical protein
MNAKVLIAGVAVAVMATGAVSAKTMKHSTSGGAYAAPSQPIPYGQLDGYMKASPKQRAAMSANGMGADTSATAPAGSSNMGAGSPADSNGMSAGSPSNGSMSNGSMSNGSMTGGSMSNDPGAKAAAPATDSTTPPK